MAVKSSRFTATAYYLNGHHQPGVPSDLFFDELSDIIKHVIMTDTLRLSCSATSTSTSITLTTRMAALLHRIISDFCLTNYHVRPTDTGGTLSTSSPVAPTEPHLLFLTSKLGLFLTMHLPYDSLGVTSSTNRRSDRKELENVRRWCPTKWALFYHIDQCLLPFQLYDDTLLSLLNDHAPSRTAFVRTSPCVLWVDAACKDEKVRIRRLEYSYHQSWSPVDKAALTTGLEKCRSFLELKQQEIWSNQVYNSRHGRTSLCFWISRAPSQTLCRYVLGFLHP